jgi:hypothetical protein
MCDRKARLAAVSRHIPRIPDRLYTDRGEGGGGGRRRRAIECDKRLAGPRYRLLSIFRGIRMGFRVKARRITKTNDATNMRFTSLYLDPSRWTNDTRDTSVQFDVREKGKRDVCNSPYSAKRRRRCRSVSTSDCMAYLSSRDNRKRTCRLYSRV